MTSLRAANFKTMDPKGKFTNPQAAYTVPDAPASRVGSEPSEAASGRRSARSLSPNNRWAGTARRLLGLRPGSRGSDRAASLREKSSSQSLADLSIVIDGTRSSTPSGSVRSRDMSPESLRRFLSEDPPFTPPPVEQSPVLYIPDEIIEELEDDDNFATSAVSDMAPMTTLSPPPFQRSLSSSVPSAARSNLYSVPTTITRDDIHLKNKPTAPIGRQALAADDVADVLQSCLSFSTRTSSLTSPISPQSTESRDLSTYSFFDDSDDEDVISSSGDDTTKIQQAGLAEAGNEYRHPNAPPKSVKNYSLPHHAAEGDRHKIQESKTTSTRNKTGMTITVPHLDGGLHNLNDHSWISGAIQPRASQRYAA
jgi:hypothetical protein